MTGAPEGVPPRQPAPPNGGERPLPRSPRAALQPEIVPPPSTRRSKRARHPLVIAGSAFFTFLIVVVVALGATLYVGRERFEARGPLAQDKVVNIPRGLGTKDISDLLVREGVGLVAVLVEHDPVGMLLRDLLGDPDGLVGPAGRGKAR